MFYQIYSGTAPWALGMLTLGLFAHVGSGLVAIASGAGALFVRKGGRLHRRFGTVFLFAMVAMALAASALASVAVARGYLGQMANVFAGAFSTYLVLTGWLTVRRPANVVGRPEIAGLAGALAIAAVVVFWLLPTMLGPGGRAQGVPIAAPIIFSCVALLVAGLDLKVILKGGIAGTPRVRRHLWRLCLGLFIATGSFFIGQQKDMPAAVQGSPVLLLLGFAPVAAMVFWLVAVAKGGVGRSSAPFVLAK